MLLREIIEAQYDDASIFRFGYALVVKDDQLLFIDELGNEFDLDANDTRMFLYRETINFTRDGKVLIFTDEGAKLLNTEGKKSYLEERC